jgi:hypothetical protein
MIKEQAGKPSRLRSVVVDEGKRTLKVNASDLYHLKRAKQERAANGAAGDESDT